MVQEVSQKKQNRQKRQNLQNVQNLQKSKVEKTGEFMQKYVYVFSSIVMNTPMKMTNLEYEIRVPKKIYDSAKMTENVSYKIYLSSLWL